MRVAAQQAACAGLDANYSSDGALLCSATVQASGLAGCHAPLASSSGLGLAVTLDVPLAEYRNAQAKVTSEQLMASLGQSVLAELQLGGTSYGAAVLCETFAKLELSATVTALGMETGANPNPNPTITLTLTPP